MSTSKSGPVCSSERLLLTLTFGEYLTKQARRSDMCWVERLWLRSTPLSHNCTYFHALICHCVSKEHTDWTESLSQRWLVFELPFHWRANIQQLLVRANVSLSVLAISTFRWSFCLKFSTRSSQCQYALGARGNSFAASHTFSLQLAGGGTICGC